jgi:hypothetical protein
VLGSRLLPLALATAALAAGAAGLGTLALWLGLLTVAAAASVAFVAVSDVLEERAPRLQAVACALALGLTLLASAARASAPTGSGSSPIATWALVLALGAYAVPLVAWMLRPARIPREARSRRRLRPAEVDELLSRAA